jgi:enoyl-CoA hydratase/carnithine racemase
MDQAQRATPTESDEVLYDVADHIAVITLNAPERMNTISGPMLNDLTRLLIRTNEDRDVRCVILTGNGRAFCAGLDLRKERSGDGISAASSPTSLDLRNTPPTVLQAMDKPTICAVNGGAAGYGMDTALGCDIRIMAESAKLAAAFVKRGVVPESGGTWFLPRMIGWAKASELIFTGRTLSARESLEWGLANEVVPDAALMGRAREVAREIAANAPLAVQAAKRMMRMGLNETFPDHVHHVYLQLLPLFKTQDMQEGIKAFMEKREPKFEGRGLPSALFGCRFRDRVRLPVGNDHLDRVLDPFAGVAQGGWQVGQRKRVGMDFRRVEAFLSHQRHGAAGSAAAFASNSVSVDVVLHEMRDIDRDRIVRKRGEADLAAAVGHVNGLIDRCFGSGALDHIVGAETVSELLDHLNGILVVDIDDAIGA